MSKLGIACELVNRGTYNFYCGLDRPTWRITDCEVLHVAYKIIMATGFYIATWTYVSYRAVVE